MPKEERGFKYQKRSKDTLKERANMKGGNYDTYIKPKFKQWKPKDGKNVIRILPPTWEKAKHYGLDIFVNFNIGADNQSYLSLSKHGKGADPLAEARRDAQKEGDKDLAKALNPSQRILYWIIDRMDEDEGPLLWAAPFTFDKSLSNLCIDEDTKDVIFIDGPSDGRDVRFYKEGTGLLTKYDPSKMKVLKPSNIHEDEGLEAEWLDFIAENQLPDVLNFYDYDHIAATFGGQAGRRDEDDPESEEKTIRSRKACDPGEDEVDEKPVRSRTRRSDPEQEELPLKTRGPRRDQELDEDEVEEKPARTRQRARPDPEPDYEDEDEKPARRSSSRKQADPDDDDDVEEKPAARKRVRAEPEDEDEALPTKSRRGKTESEDEDEDTGGSLRAKLAARRRTRNSEED